MFCFFVVGGFLVLLEGWGTGPLLFDYSLVFSCFRFDFISLFLSCLVFLLWVCLDFVGTGMSFFSFFCVFVSMLFGVISFFISKAFLFWVCYEVSIIFLLFLLIVDSPYSERYVALWYLLGYVVLSSLPMMLCLLLVSWEVGCFSMWDWGFYSVDSGFYIFILLALFFIMKIPLFPFHTWLPVVHAEASSPVSVCLSGYVMKLGILGVIRFVYKILPFDVFSFAYVSLMFFLCVMFFLMSCQELDGKRWLAFLSLSHIVIPVVCFFVGDCVIYSLGMYYCFSHGLSAGLMFVLLWFFYNVSGSRNWFVLKGLLGGSFFFRVIFVGGLCTAASFPPTPQFFMEVWGVFCSLSVSLGLVLLFLCYLFFAGLVPIVMLGGLLTRHMSVSMACSGGFGFYGSLCFLLYWCGVSFALF